jgi:hypothetical protein
MKKPDFTIPDMFWTGTALLLVCPVHFVLGAIGLLMIWPFAISYVPTALVALCVEPVGYALARVFRSQPDRAHRLLSTMLWVVCGLTHPLSEITVYGEEVNAIIIAMAIAAAWRVAPRDVRPVAAGAIVVVLVCLVAHIWDSTFGRWDTMSVTYAVLYGATALPLAVFAVERTVHTFLQRRTPERSCHEER